MYVPFPKFAIYDIFHSFPPILASYHNFRLIPSPTRKIMQSTRKIMQSELAIVQKVIFIETKAVIHRNFWFMPTGPTGVDRQRPEYVPNGRDRSISWFLLHWHCHKMTLQLNEFVSLARASWALLAVTIPPSRLSDRYRGDPRHPEHGERAEGRVQRQVNCVHVAADAAPQVALPERDDKFGDWCMNSSLWVIIPLHYSDSWG